MPSPPTPCRLARLLLPCIFLAAICLQAAEEDSGTQAGDADAPAPDEAEQACEATDTPQPAPPVHFEIRLLAEPQDREHVEVEYISVKTDGKQVELPMHTQVLVSRQDVISARLLEAPEQPFRLRLELKEPATERLLRATASSLGQQLAIIYEHRLLAVITLLKPQGTPLEFEGRDEDWPARAPVVAARLNNPPDQP